SRRRRRSPRRRSFRRGRSSGPEGARRSRHLARRERREGGRGARLGTSRRRGAVRRPPSPRFASDSLLFLPCETLSLPPNQGRATCLRLLRSTKTATFLRTISASSGFTR